MSGIPVMLITQYRALGQGEFVMSRREKSKAHNDSRLTSGGPTIFSVGRLLPFGTFLVSICTDFIPILKRIFTLVTSGSLCIIRLWHSHEMTSKSSKTCLR